MHTVTNPKYIAHYSFSCSNHAKFGQWENFWRAPMYFGHVLIIFRALPCFLVEEGVLARFFLVLSLLNLSASQRASNFLTATSFRQDRPSPLTTITLSHPFSCLCRSPPNAGSGGSSLLLSISSTCSCFGYLCLSPRRLVVWGADEALRIIIFKNRIHHFSMEPWFLFFLINCILLY